MLKCWACKYQKKISRGTITPGGKQTYIITCKKEGCLLADWDASVSDLPCWKEADK